MPRAIRMIALASMATLAVRILTGLFICGICTTHASTHTYRLDKIDRDSNSKGHETGLQLPTHRVTEPGVSLFHQHEDCDIITFSGDSVIKHTINEDGGHEENITLQFMAFEKRFLIDLHLTRDLFSNAYSRKIVHENWKDFQEPMHRKEHCYYQGQIQNVPSSVAALSSCDGFKGYVSDGKETYHIHPVNGSVHRIFRNSDMKDLPFKCGTDRHEDGHPAHHLFTKHRKKRSIHGPYDSNKNTRYVELYMVNDYRTYDLHGKNATALFKRSQDIANIVNSLYRQLNIYVVLVGAEVWGTGDRITITTSAENTMKNFLRYRKLRINPYHPNDNAQLITGITFDHGVMGKAFKGPICTHQSSGGVSMDYDGLVTLVANTMAHELGHNFGMEHDNDTTCSCPQAKCIMAATSGRLSPQFWSSCSQNSLQEAFELGMDYCLRNIPSTVFNGPVCGNGLVEDGEECDCGLSKDCTNRCCNATTCLLHPQAECGAGQCCDFNTCKPKEEATLCRESRGECDLPEFCNGTSQFCPPDVFLQQGKSCSNGQSYCYKGQCRTQNRQCKLLWGDTGRVSDPFCFQQLNVRGNVDGNCGYNWTTGRFKTCEREDVLCGLLHCVHLNEKLMFWRDNLALDMRALFLTRGNTQYVCRSTMLDVGLDMPDPGLVPDGAKCEDRKICIKQKCTSLMKLKIAECPDCHDNGVCNSNGHCHCNVGYAPPLCDRPGYGGSIDSGPVSNEYANRDLLIVLLVLFLVILPLLALIVLAYCRRKQLKACWERGPRAKFSALKKPKQPQSPRSSNVQKRWSSGATRPGTHLEISGPLLQDSAASDNSAQSSRFPLPSSTAPPIYKPSASKNSVPPQKPNPPAADLSSKDSKSLTNSTNCSASSQPVKNRPAASKVGSDTSKPSPIVSQSTVQQKQLLKDKEVKKSESSDVRKIDQPTFPNKAGPTQNPPTSPTKGDRKLIHSQSLQEPQVSFQPVGIVKRQSFRGAEISNPVLVSTTNRDSDLFPDFEVDKSGIIARPVKKQHSIHGSNPTAEVVRDGCRNAVRRSQSDRPLSPKKPATVSDSNTKPIQQLPDFSRRPLPPEPVLECDSEPLYMNEGLSDLEDLKAHISSAFEGLYLNLPTADSTTSEPTPDQKQTPSVSSSAFNKTNKTASTNSTSSLSKPAEPKRAGPPRPSQGPPVSSSKPSTVSKATSLERVLNNPVKFPFNTAGVSGATPTPVAAASGLGKTPTTLSSSVGSKIAPGMSDKPSTTITPNFRSAVRGPFGNTINKTPGNTDISNTGSSSTAGSQNIISSPVVQTPSSTSAQIRPVISSAYKGNTPSATNKDPMKSITEMGVSGSASTCAKVPPSSCKWPSVTTNTSGRDLGPGSVNKRIGSSTINSRAPPLAKNNVPKISGTTSSTTSSVPKVSGTTGSTTSILPKVSATTGSTTSSVPKVSGTTGSTTSSVPKVSGRTGSTASSVPKVLGTTGSTTSSVPPKVSGTKGSTTSSVPPKVSGTKGSTTSSVPKVSGTTGSTAKSARQSTGKGGDIDQQKSGISSNRPSVAVKPGAGKSVRSYHF